MRLVCLCTFLIASGLLVGVTATAAAAQALPVVTADVVVTASATPVPAATLGRAVTMLTREDLSTFGVSSIIDGLRLLPGMDPKARGGRDVQTDFSIRGATFGQALVLLDGVRLNNTQTGHHNGEIPAPLASIDRIEVVAGPGSAVHGADALGGTIQILTRTDAHVSAEGALAEFGTIAVQGSASGGVLPRAVTISGWVARSDGFMFDRDYAHGGVSGRARVAEGLTLDLRHQRRAFGANGFYGNSPSKEWTDGTTASAAWARTGSLWFRQARAAARRHHDRFRWDINRPGFSENEHASDAVDVDLTASRQDRALRTTIAAGGGADRIDSSNLGNRTYGRVYSFVETIWSATDTVSVQGGWRLDRYSTFGTASNPSLAVSMALSPSVRVRASVARAFRIPTFTERYYTDPVHRATEALRPEHGWSVDAGVDLTAAGWTIAVSPFARWDEDIIDWVKDTPADRWRTTNVHEASARGVELSAARRWTSALLRAHYTWLDVDAVRAGPISKYVLEYARQSAGLALSMPVGPRTRMAVTADARDRVDGQRYVLMGARLTRTVGRVDLHAEAVNLLDSTYREVAGVPMPGRMLGIGLRLR